MNQDADVEGFTVSQRQHKSIRKGEDVKVRRSPQAMACRERYAQELGRPHRLLLEGRVEVRYTDT
jgi:RNA-directed DNA polymerase